MVAKKIWVLTMMLVVGTILAACGGNEGKQQETSATETTEKVNLTYAFFAPDTTFPAVQMKKWAEELEERTAGQVEVEMFFGGSLLEANNMFEGVSNGTADIGLTATSYEPGRFPLMEISDLPSGYPSSKVASQVVHDLIEEYPPKELENFKIITSFATEPSYIQSIDPIASLEELQGKQLRISGGLTPVMEALGAAPVGMSQAEVTEALQTGVIEGNVSSREVLKDFKVSESAKYVTDYPLTITSFVAVMNKEKWQSLPDNVKEVIDELNQEMSVFTGQYLDEHVEEAMEWSKKSENLEVVKLNEKEKARWDTALEEIQDKKVEEVNKEGLPGSEYQERLYELIDKYSK
ncbi:TRAP-type C4-dicarboxylate transport system, substrate-binding protein [Alteribacillus persepolensis]|uniref:TRAP-type C4-dicarboxylate transport system, substrate-binding protein n=1 Tax=Alteribacillus persepolensis TaxID=568899 RepID=A0A1G8F8S2_9BACI|nr:TRAP transporter substrate-binding protein [Alteribacillus persepolensis]SDH78532.1 TRAP-type C4-dicarboxylate transport system, substrate-binding protein [Alteribacillus persepolensis]